MAYDPITDINTTNGIGEFLNYVNIVTNSWISNMLLIFIYIAVVMGYYGETKDFAGAVSISGIVVLVIAVLLWVVNFVSTITLGIVIAICFVGVMYVLHDRGNS